jgi:hypothetical protein
MNERQTAEAAGATNPQRKSRRSDDADPERQEAGASKPQRKSRRSDDADPERLSVDAYVQYLRALGEAWTEEDLPRRWLQAVREYLQAIHEAPMPEAVRGGYSDETLRAYARVIRELLLPQDAGQQFAQAYSEYLHGLSETKAWDEFARRVQDAYRTYVRDLDEALAAQEVERRSEEAYRAYVGALRQMWADVDAESLDLAAMSAISQSMTAAAWLMTLAQAAVRQRGMAHGALSSALVV